MKTLALILILGAPSLRDDGDRVLFDFDKAEDAAAWSARDAARDPKAALAWSSDKALRITFAGGRWPSVATSAVPEDWSPCKTLAAEVTVTRPCLIGFQVVQEKSKRDD